MTHDAHDRIEQLIDRAASSITDVETSAAFTAHVMAAIDAPAAPRRSWWRPLPAFAAACALLVVAVAAWWPRTTGPGVGPARAHILASRSLPTTAVLVPSANAIAAPSRGFIAARVRRTAPPAFRGVPTFEPISIDGLAITPIDAESAPLVVEPLPAPAPIQLDLVAIDAIELSPSPRPAPPQSPGGRR